MNIIEEQKKNGEINTDVTASIKTPPVPPSAKKEYSKPTMVFLSQTEIEGAKTHAHQVETGAPPYTLAGFNGPS